MQVDQLFFGAFGFTAGAASALLLSVLGRSGCVTSLVSELTTLVERGSDDESIDLVGCSHLAKCQELRVP